MAILTSTLLFNRAFLKSKKTPIPVKGRGLCYRGTTLISFDYYNLHSLHSEITAFNRNIFQIKLDPPNVDSRGEFTQGSP
jgi:hypothetical protein